MPLYEYRCRSCDHGWEERREWKAPQPHCPACQSDDVRKVYHAATLVFKGSGWHQNDYTSTGERRTGSKAAGDGESAGAVSGGSSSTPSATDSATASSKESSTGSAKEASTPSPAPAK